MKRFVFFLLAAALLLTLCACAAEVDGPALESDPGDVPPADAPAEAPVEEPTEEAQPETIGVLGQFSAVDLAGNTVTQEILADYDLTMVNVWATFCGPCLNEMPDLGLLAAEYAPKGVQILGLVTDVLDSQGNLDADQMALAQEIVDSTGAAYPHMAPQEDLFGLLGQISSVPTTFFVDAEGRQVGGVYVGSRAKDDWAAILDETLAEMGQ